MANSLGGINLAQIAQEGLELLQPKLVILKNFTRDFSDDIAQVGESVTTRVAAVEDAEDFSGGITASDANSTPYTITLNLELGKAKAFTQAELSKGGINLIRQTFFPAMVNAVGLGVTKEVVKLLTAANFPSVTTVLAADFDADQVADEAGILDNAHFPDDGRFMILQPDYTTNLVKDDAIQRVDASGSNAALRESSVGRLHRFNVERFNGFPTGTTATENLVGFYGMRDGLLIAGRFPAMPDEGHEVVSVENVIDPETGFPLQFQSFYVPKERKWYIAVVTLFGVKNGPSDRVRRIRSAAP